MSPYITFDLIFVPVFFLWFFLPKLGAIDLQFHPVTTIVWILWIPFHMFFLIWIVKLIYGTPKESVPSPKVEPKKSDKVDIVVAQGKIN